MECSRAYSVERHLDQLTIWWNCHATTMDKTSSFARRAIICRVRDSQRRHHARHIPGWWLFAAAKVRVPSVDQIAPRRVFQFQNLRMGFSLACRGFLKVLLSTSLCGSWARCRVSGWLRALACIKVARIWCESVLRAVVQTCQAWSLWTERKQWKRAADWSRP